VCRLQSRDHLVLFHQTNSRNACSLNRPNSRNRFSALSWKGLNKWFVVILSVLRPAIGLSEGWTKARQGSPKLIITNKGIVRSLPAHPLSGTHTLAAGIMEQWNRWRPHRCDWFGCPLSQQLFTRFLHITSFHVTFYTDNFCCFYPFSEIQSFRICNGGGDAGTERCRVPTTWVITMWPAGSADRGCKVSHPYTPWRKQHGGCWNRQNYSESDFVVCNPQLALWQNNVNMVFITDKHKFVLYWK
jgi:hypothetical protein